MSIDKSESSEQPKSAGALAPQQSITIHASVGNPCSKRRGEASEAEFIARASSLNFSVAKPWGESDSYDVLVGASRGFWRVQVKCAACYHRGQYMVKAGGDAGNYTPDDIDFLAAHIIPENIWYIIPIEAFAGVTMIHLSPHGTGKAKYEKYREAWCLLACEPQARGWKDVPVICRCQDLPVRCAVCPSGKCGTDTPLGKLGAGSVRRL